MNRSPVRLLSALALVALPGLAAADALVRIACFDANEGAEVTLNGVAKGSCPLDVMATPGKTVIRARKQTDATHEQVWETTLMLGDGAVKRVEVELSAPQLTAAAQREQERQAREKAQAALVADMAAARAGDEAALARVVAAFEAAGSTQEAATWRNRLERVRATRIQAEANGGSVPAMDDIASRYEKGLGVEVDAAKATEWRNKAAAARNQKLVEQRRAALLKERDNISFVGFTKTMLQGAGDVMAGRRPDVTSGPTMATLVVLYVPVWLASDLVTAPFNTSAMVRVNKQLNALALQPSSWASPDSLLARAERQPDAAR